MHSFSMQGLLCVFIGGGIGAICRYGISYFTLATSVTLRFPIGTFLVNCLGCLLIGFLSRFLLHDDPSNLYPRLILMTGFAGGFTTFSAFGLETMELIQNDAHIAALIYVIASVILGLVLCVLGYGIARTIA